MSKRRLGGIVGPLVLVGVGIVLLLNTLGAVTWNVWGQIGRYWPVVVILFALNLLWQNLRER